MVSWLKDAVFYEIYPQSFYDSNGDGIGDLKGITEKLDYVKDLGANALWINPIYDSPFMDGGYDVRDYYKIAERYGKEEDFIEMLRTAHEKGIKVLLDLVPGHTSDQNKWFLEAKKAEKNQYSQRYIFTDSVWECPEQYKFICGVCERDGNYLVNYFSSQPALNYGFYDITHPSWQKSHKSKEAKETADSLKDIMRFWLDKGIDGFRVDMADSLVKNDNEKIATAQIWADVRKMMDKDYPNCVLVSEWCNPIKAINDGGFHMDFYLDHYGNGYSRLFRYMEEGENKAFFHKNGKGDIKAFLDEYLPNLKKTKDNGYISFMTNNHDMPRMTNYADIETVKIAHATLLMFPGVPFIYYGDEIGMNYQADLVSKEGGYSRTGSRTPMQWDSTKNLGFSTCDEKDMYLPVDKSKDAPTVEKCIADKNSIYYVIKDMISLRHQNPDLQSDGEIDVLYAEKERYPFIFRRGKFVIIVNPSGKEWTAPLDIKEFEEVYKIGETVISKGEVKTMGSSFMIIKTK
ncbi:MAG: alpha-amylase family glycosyl hydrolase [Acutalibacteraceae bacterium]